MSTPKLLIANDSGSKELIAPLQRLGLPAEPARLEYGDLAFMGRGERGTSLYIGIEFKKLAEFVQSVCVTKRFQGHQLLGMVHPESGFDRRYILIEGDFHHDDEGRAVVFRGAGRRAPLKGAPGAVALEQEILNLAVRGGCYVVSRNTRRDCLRFIVACFRYWTDKDLDAHKSHLAMYAPDLDKGLFTPPSDFRKALTVLLPGIGLAVSGAVERYVGAETALRDQLLRVLGMTETEWAELEIPGKQGARRLGPSRAHTIMEALR